MKRKNRWRKLLAAVTGAFLMFTGGCSQELPGEEEPPAPQTYTWSQIMVIAVTERNRYEQVYTDRIWDAVMEDRKSVV